MGKTPTRRLESYNQRTDVPNLFVRMACMASSSCVNPSLTYMPITVRAVTTRERVEAQNL